MTFPFLIVDLWDHLRSAAFEKQGCLQRRMQNVSQKDHHGFVAHCNRNAHRNNCRFCRRTWWRLHSMQRRPLIACEMHARQLVNDWTCCRSSNAPVAVECYQHPAAVPFRIADLWRRGKNDDLNNSDFEYCHEICGDLHHVTSAISV
jgi:hypothetical protein